MDSASVNKEKALETKIAAEIVFSENPGAIMRRWRRELNIPQKSLAKELGLTGSVISDYESGRRKNPGTQFVKRFVRSLLQISNRSQTNLAQNLIESSTFVGEEILHIEEFPNPVNVNRFRRAISGKIVNQVKAAKDIKGLTVVDSEMVLERLSGWRFLQAFGRTSHRALVFTNIKPGRSPILALRFSILKPVVLVYHIFLPGESDIRLAQSDQIVLIHTKMARIEDVIRSIRRLTGELTNT